MGRYFVYKDCRILGPYEREDLSQAGPLRPETLVCEEGAAGRELDWRSAEEVSDLSGLTLPAAGALEGEPGGGAATAVLERLELETLGVPGFEEGAQDWILKALEDEDIRRLFGEAPAGGEVKDLGEARERIRTLNARLEALQGRITELERRPPPPALGASAAPPAAAPSPAAKPPAPEPPPQASSGPPSGVRFQPRRLKPAEEAPETAPSGPKPKFSVKSLKPAAPAPAEGAPQGAEARAPAPAAPPPPAEAPPAGGGVLEEPSPAPAEETAGEQAGEGRPSGRAFKFTRKEGATPQSGPATPPPKTLRIRRGGLTPIRREPGAEAEEAAAAESAPAPVREEPPREGPPAETPQALPVVQPPAPVREEPPVEALPPAPTLAPLPPSPTAAPPSETPAPTLTPSAFAPPPPPSGEAPQPFPPIPFGRAETTAPPPGESPGADAAPPATMAFAAPGKSEAAAGVPTPGTQEVIARLAKPAPPPPPKPKPSGRRVPLFVLGSGALLLGLVAAFFMFLRNPKDVRTMISMEGDSQPLGMEAPEQGPAEQAEPPPQAAAPVQAAPEAPPPAAPPAAVQAAPVPDPGEEAITLVKKYPLYGEKGTVGEWLQFSFMADPASGNEEEWTAGAVEATTYLVQYRVKPGPRSAVKDPITYLFEADTSRRTVKGSNPAARELMGGPARPAKPKRRLQARRARPAPRAERPGRPRQVPLLPLPSDSDLLPPAEDDAEFRKDTVSDAP